MSVLTSCGSRTPTGAVEPRDAWARATAPGQESGGVFLTLDNEHGPADRLVGGTTPVAQSVEFHSMTMDGSIMRMKQLAGVDLPSGTSVVLEPGGTHVMLVGLKAPLEVGQTFPLTLRFEKAGGRQLDVKVRSIASMGHSGGNDE